MIKLIIHHLYRTHFYCLTTCRGRRKGAWVGGDHRKCRTNWLPKIQRAGNSYSLADASFYLAQAHGDGFYLANFIKEKVNVFNFTVYENDSRKYHLSIQEVFRFLQLSYH